MALVVDFRSRGAGRLQADIARLSTDITKLQRGVGGRRAMAISYGAEQAATQLNRISRYTQRSLESTVGLAADFEDQMGRVAALSTRGMGEGEAAKTVELLSKRARELGAATRYTAREAGAGMELLAMAGFDATKQMQTIPSVLNLATIGHIEVAKAADIATNIMGGFQVEAEKSGMMVDRLAAALTSGNVNLQELGHTMKYVAPVAHGLGQDLESMLGWADVLGDAGIKGGMAGTGSREILNRLASGSGEGIFKSYGVALKDDEGNLRDATQILSELGLAMARSGKGNAELSSEIVDIFGKRHRSAAMVLMAAGAKGVASQDEDLSAMQELLADAGLSEKDRAKIWEQSLQSRIGKVKESDGLAKTMAEKMDATTKGQWRAFKSALEETGIVIGEQILPILIDMMHELKPVVLQIANWAKKHPGLIKAIAKTALATVALTAIATPILHLVSALYGLRGLVGRGFGSFVGAGAGLGGVGGVGLGGAGFGAAGALGAGGGFGRSPKPRSQRYRVGMTGGQFGPAFEGEAPLHRYGQRRGWQTTGTGALGWQAGQNSPDGVWASPEAAFTQSARERRARRGARGARGFNKRSLAGRKYAAAQAQQRRAAKMQARANRAQNRANRRAARRGAGGSKFGGAMQKAGVAAMGWGLGQAAGHGINWASEGLLGRSATDYTLGGLNWFDRRTGGGLSHGLREWYGTETDASLGLSDAELNAMHGGLTSMRGGAQFLSQQRGPTKEGQARLSQLEREKKLAKELGVTYETVRRAREQGFSADKMRDKDWMAKFVADEQAKDQKWAEERARKKQLSAAGSKAGQLMRAKLLAEGYDKDDQHVLRAQRVAAKRARGETTGPLGALGDLLKTKIIEGIKEGADKSTIQALVPSAGVTGAEAGG